MKGRHVPPSRRRYEETHPAVSVRVTLAERERLRAMHERGISMGDILDAGLNGVKLTNEHTAKIRKEAYERGFTAAFERYAIRLPCPGCKKPVVVEGDQALRAARKRVEGVFWHPGCWDTRERFQVVRQRP